MAVFAFVKWYDDKDVLVSMDDIEISDTISLKHLKDVYENIRFDDYYLIKDAEEKVKNFILTSLKHRFCNAVVEESFLPLIKIKKDPNV